MAATDADLNELYVQHVQPIRDYLFRLSGDGGLAEDLVQETFYRAMRQLLGGSRVNYVSAWLYRIAGDRRRNGPEHKCGEKRDLPGPQAVRRALRRAIPGQRRRGLDDA